MDGRTLPLNTALLSHFKLYFAKVKLFLLLITKIPNAFKIMLLVCKLKLIQLRLRYKIWIIVQMLFGISSSVSMRSNVTFCAIWYSLERKFLFEANNGFEWLVELLQSTRNYTKFAFCPQFVFVCFLHFVCSWCWIFKYVVWIHTSGSQHYAWRIYLPSVVCNIILCIKKGKVHRCTVTEALYRPYGP
jgi:hypothetical protein